MLQKVTSEAKVSNWINDLSQKKQHRPYNSFQHRFRYQQRFVTFVILSREPYQTKSSLGHTESFL